MLCKKKNHKHLSSTFQGYGVHLNEIKCFKAFVDFLGVPKCINTQQCTQFKYSNAHTGIYYFHMIENSPYRAQSTYQTLNERECDRQVH